MYTEHFGLKTLPFENVPDPKFFFDEGEHARIHRSLRDSLNAGRGLIVVAGPIGSGKTTLSQLIISEFSKDLKLIWMAQPPAGSMDFYIFVAQELGLEPRMTERTFLLRDIREALLKMNSQGRKCLIIIDESHLMSDDAIEGIRLLNNLEEGARKLVQMLLLGQDELLEIIRRPELEPFRQRIASLEILGKMDPERIRKYVSHRIQVAGGAQSLFSDTGLEAAGLAFGKEGTPRLINLLCEKSLKAASEKGKTAVDVDDVYQAADSMGMSKEVFHFRMKLKEMDRIQHATPSAVKKDTINESGKTVQQKTVQERPLDLIIQEAVQERPLDLIIEEKETARRGLRLPVALFVISLSALVIGIFFFCQGSDSSGITDCLLRLLEEVLY